MTVQRKQLFNVLEGARQKLSDISPSEWAELYRELSTDGTPFPGKFSYDRTPYLREPVNQLSPASAAQIVTVMKGAQIGFSTGVIENGIGWIMKENPGNILFLSGHADLSEEAMAKKIDVMIETSGLRGLIRPHVRKKKNQRTGDTAKSKEFPGGSLIAGSANNHKLLAQRSVQYGFIDDYDDVKIASKTDGSTTKLIEQRFAAYYLKMKLFFISTPRIQSASNIEPLYLRGDQRRYMIPCPHCYAFLPLEWSVDIIGTDKKEKAGIFYKLDNHDRLIVESVGYICQHCGGFFDDSHKHEQNMNGYWQPTAEPSRVGMYSYHISSLYAPPGMYDWKKYVGDYLEANPPNGTRNESAHQTFQNTCLGLTYEQQGEGPKANDLQKNTRDYPIGIVPRTVSMRDGNGRILLVTMAADMNGLEDDARIDYEIVAWSEGGATYSIRHGSIGTFIPRENSLKIKTDRERWSYNHNASNSVWPELKKIIETPINSDDGKSMKIMMTGLDCGYLDNHVYPFMDKFKSFKSTPVIGLKGKDEAKSITYGADKSTFRPARERQNLFLVEVNSLKDDLADFMKLPWDPGNDHEQPANFMNFPAPGGGLYTFNRFFSHFEAEEKIIEKKQDRPAMYRWKKKNSVVQNHQMDCRIYNMVVRDIFLFQFAKAIKAPNPQKFTWQEYVSKISGVSK